MKKRSTECTWESVVSFHYWVDWDLFLFGMKYMGEGLELAAGPKMKDLLEKLTRNRVMGFLLGALVTVVTSHHRDNRYGHGIY